MKLIKIEDLKGGEVLAKPIITDSFKILLSEGTQINIDYLDKLRNLGIDEVYIEDIDKAHLQEVVLLKADIEETFKNKVKEVLEKHTYSGHTELTELIETADGIINNILNEDEVVEKIYDIKERSADIYEHSISLCSLATLTALKLKVSREKVHDIGVGCLLHDLGLRYLTIKYENQNLADLSKVQLNEYMKHPVYGYSAIKDETWLSNLSKSIVLYHHEKLDGSGYPLHAKDISFDVGIVCICDVFDEMICGIGCQRFKVYEAVEYLKTFSGVKFYPKAVEALLEFTAVYPVGAMVELSDGSVGKVLRQNQDFSDRPVIMLLKDSKQNDIPKGKEIDLVKVNNLFIEKELM